MDTTVNNPGLIAAPNRTTKPGSTAPADNRSAKPEKVETPQAVSSADTAQKAPLKHSAPSSALTTYKDQESGRLIVRVFDRENGDVLVEFPPEKAFRSIQEVLQAAGLNPKKNISV